MKKILIISSILLSITLLSGCVPGDGTNNAENLAGFFWGIWHGAVAPISLLVSFFDNEIRIYEVMNSGVLYDLGFYIAIISGVGGISHSHKGK